ncbi:MAG: pseudouridine synthase [Bacteroidales bacterium]
MDSERRPKRPRISATPYEAGREGNNGYRNERSDFGQMDNRDGYRPRNSYNNDQRSNNRFDNSQGNYNREGGFNKRPFEQRQNNFGERRSYGNDERRTYNNNNNNRSYGNNSNSYGNNNNNNRSYDNYDRGNYGNNQRNNNYDGGQRNNYGGDQRGSYGGQRNNNYGDDQRGNYGGGQRSNNYGGGQRSNNYGGGQRSNNYGGGQRSNNYGGGQRSNNFGGGQRSNSYGGGQRSNSFGGGRPQNRGGNFSNNRFNANGAGQNASRVQNYDPNAKYSKKKQIEYQDLFTDPNEPIRLNKFLANAGICSRREADEFIAKGMVTVNGEVVTELGTKIHRTDEVKFNESDVRPEGKVYILLNKPKDCVTTSDDPQERLTVLDLVKNACSERIYPVGRLDRNTTGVLLLTNDGDLASKLTHPKYDKKKIYHVWLDKDVTMEDIKQIATGIELEDGEIHADAISYADETDPKQIGIEIHSGRNRIVRRIFEHLGYRVVKLDRVMFAGLTKKNLPRGRWRYLTQEEVNMLKMGAFE